MPLDVPDRVSPIAMPDDHFGAALIEQSAALSAYARRLTGGGADADDLLQDTMLRCWSARASFTAGTSLIAWTRTVMKNSFLTGRRRARFHADLPDEARDRMLKVDETQSLAIWLRDTDWALSELPPDQREAVLLASQGVSIEEAAMRLGVATGTVKSRVARGRARLRALIEEGSTPLLAERTGGKDKPSLMSDRPIQPRKKKKKKRDWRGVKIG
ncbi:sigma-70 family RNA polymerase sigma factor [Sphingomonas abaci]|uniref:RNA polymerase sigma-70 factor (ECF subfamily) n=1 Tax=Sphingomonas abaci TaxID=237611 RepID=A0A7W7AM92_9SPHN|nr:sigma-70 family RNA polymerase sigma factor [Sphingomonas abaci]MBB4619658.1 RNA polymerase sigma-70 factor (ECF subfamily) [Sphingomonas abaci]